ncbi:MAG TPA: SCO family protein, partial [Methylomirabilota bacterium]|nr:SCO family protein [Methylomirabilota bacterium]
MTAVLGWWAFAFLPLPSAPPAWLAAARVACFGAMERGLPDAAGWMMLLLAPASLLAAILVIWGGDLVSVLHAARSRAGLVIVAAFALATLVEGGWVVDRLHAARTAEAWAPSPLDDGPLPAAYPRETRPAPDFTLLDQHGATLSLASLAGRPVVVTFVFAHCQTMCPFIVATLKRAMPDGGEVLLVTLDPWRDTPSALAGVAARWELPANFHF